MTEQMSYFDSAVDLIGRNKKSIFCIPMGCGRMLIIAKAISDYDFKKTIIVTPKIVHEQWIRELKRFEFDLDRVELRSPQKFIRCFKEMSADLFIISMTRIHADTRVIEAAKDLAQRTEHVILNPMKLSDPVPTEFADYPIITMNVESTVPIIPKGWWR